MKLELLHDVGSNCSQRVHWALNYKGIAFKSLLFSQMPIDQVRLISPLGKVPALIVEGMTLSESVAILEFLDENFPERPLLPIDPWRRAKVREAVEIVNGWIHPVQCSSVPRFFIPKLDADEVKEYRRRWLTNTLPVLHDHLLFKESLFAIGDMFSWADLTTIPIYCKALSLGVPLEQFPKFQSHARHCINEKSIGRSCPDDLLAALRESHVL